MQCKLKASQKEKTEQRSENKQIKASTLRKNKLKRIKEKKTKGQLKERIKQTNYINKRLQKTIIKTNKQMTEPTEDKRNV